MSRQDYNLRDVAGDRSPDILGNKMETFGLLNDRGRPTSSSSSPACSNRGVSTTPGSGTSLNYQGSVSDLSNANNMIGIQSDGRSFSNDRRNLQLSDKALGLPNDDELDLISSSTEMNMNNSKASGEGPELTYRLMAACLFQLPMGMIWSTIGLIVLPYEAEQFYPSAHSGFLGVLLTIAGTSQIISPIVGKMSDSYRSVFGRRRPFMIYGTIATAIGVLGLSYTSANRLMVCYAIALFISQVGLNVIYSATVLGLVPDTLEAQGESDKAAASGTIAIFQFLGNLLGMLFMIFTADNQIRVVYPAYLISILLTAAVVWLSCPEESSLYLHIPSENGNDTELNSPHNSQSPNSDNGLLPTGRAHATSSSYNGKDTSGSQKRQGLLQIAGSMLKKSVRAMTFDLKNERDFLWVFVGRTMYYLSMSCLSFIFYYVRDIGGVEEETKRKYYVAIIVVMAQVTGAITAYPAGKLSDTVGRKKLIYLSCILMSVMFFWYLAIPYVAKTEGEAPIGALVMGSMIYGVATGCYMSVDYALAIDCLPDKNSKGASEALGLWGISGFIGSYIGPMGGGVLLEHFGSTGRKEHYTYSGYVALLSAGASMCLVSAYVTSFVKKSR